MSLHSWRIWKGGPAVLAKAETCRFCLVRRAPEREEGGPQEFCDAVFRTKPRTRDVSADEADDIIERILEDDYSMALLILEDDE